MKATLLLLAGVQGILLSMALIISGIKNRHANIFLGLVLAVCSIELLNVWAMLIGYHSRVNIFPFWLLGSYLIIPAALWIFMMLNTNPGFTVKPKHLLLFAPAFIEVLAEFSLFYARRFVGVSTSLSKHTAWYVFTEVLPVFFMIAVLFRYWVQIKKSIPNGKSLVKSRKHLVKQYGFFIVFTSLIILWIAEMFLGFQVYSIIEMLLCALLFFLGYIVYFHPDFFETPEFNKNKKKEDSFLQYNEEKEIARLKLLFEENKIYRKTRLTLEDLAIELNLPERYVSFLINRYHNTNFNGFVNSYRVSEVLIRMSDPKESHKTLLGIAMDSGFNSKSSFNQIFKTITGETPSGYIAKAGNSSKNTIQDAHD